MFCVLPDVIPSNSVDTPIASIAWDYYFKLLLMARGQCANSVSVGQFFALSLDIVHTGSGFVAH